MEEKQMAESYPALPKRTQLRHDEKGREVLDPVPMQPPLGYRKQPSLADQIRQQVLSEKIRAWEEELGEETEEEADDFEIGDDFVPLSEYENDHIPTISALKKQAQEINDAIRHAQRKKAVDDYKKQQGIKDDPPEAEKTVKDEA